jgi:uncharacterized membrane protein
MTLLVVTCVSGAHLGAGTIWAEVALAYLAVQLILSYGVSGWVKLRNPDWRNGAALADVFALSAYPVSRDLRALGRNHGLMRAGSWAVIGFEVAFVFALLDARLMIGALAVAAVFHLANAVLFGLNRFFWAWISAYPALIWFQGRLLPLWSP